MQVSTRTLYSRAPLERHRYRRPHWRKHQANHGGSGVRGPGVGVITSSNASPAAPEPSISSTDTNKHCRYLSFALVRLVQQPVWAMIELDLGCAESFEAQQPERCLREALSCCLRRWGERGTYGAVIRRKSVACFNVLGE